MPRMSWPLWRRARTVTRAASEVKLMYGGGTPWNREGETTLVGVARLHEQRGGVARERPSRRARAATGIGSGGAVGSWGRQRLTAGDLRLTGTRGGGRL
jgi:hypothetical protein